MEHISLEQEVKAFCQNPARRFIPTTIGLSTLREQLKIEQSKPVWRHKTFVYDKKVRIPAEKRTINVRFMYPAQTDPSQKLPVLFYIHGGQFVTGDALIYDKLIRELTVRSKVALVFPEYDLAPESRAPIQQKEINYIFSQLPQLAAECRLDLDRLIVCADDVGAKFAVNLALDQALRSIKIYKMAFICPVVNRNFDTQSYYAYAGGYVTSREQMKFAWKQYLGDQNYAANPLVESPLRLDLDELGQLPETLLITAEADVVRDEGEAMAQKMRDAGVKVASIRFQGTIHDFVVYNALDQTNNCRLAMNILTDWIKPKSQARKSRKRTFLEYGEQ